MWGLSPAHSPGFGSQRGVVGGSLQVQWKEQMAFESLWQTEEGSKNTEGTWYTGKVQRFAYSLRHGSVALGHWSGGWAVVRGWHNWFAMLGRQNQARCKDFAMGI